MTLSIQWDISWHRSIGRDTKFIAPHLFVYGSAIFGQVCCGYLILGTTFGKGLWSKAESTRIWGFYGPLGAFLGVWSAATLLVLTFLDDWWHLAFGLDVRIISPIHLLILNVVIIYMFAGLLLIGRFLNDATEQARKGFHILFIIVCASLLLQIGLIQWENTTRAAMHSSFFYLYTSIAVPAVLVGLASALPYRWASTCIAGLYSISLMLVIWVLPLFPAEPRIGPVMQRITHFIPPDFPLLYIVPGFFLDLLRPYFIKRKRWMQAIAGGIVFLITFGFAQWMFAKFLMSSPGRNWFFGEYFWPYRFYQPVDIWKLVIKARINFIEMGAAFCIAVTSSWIGLTLNEWIQRIRR
jgi:hypothetical protein